MSEDGGGFLARWSRRKRAADAAPAPPPAAPAPPGAAAPAGAEAAFDPASLPPVESLDAASDFAAFLREEVPAALRRAALRRAWTLDPAIRDFVGPADYAWDFNAPGGVPGFSLDLPGDVERLLAQAVGLDAAPEPAPPAAAAAETSAPPPDPPPPATTTGHARAEPPAEAPNGLGQAALPAPAAPAMAAVPAVAAEALPPAEAPNGLGQAALPAPAAPAVATLSPARPRHGGALPS